MGRSANQCSAIKLSFVMLSVVMRSVVMLSVIILSVVAPTKQSSVPDSMKSGKTTKAETTFNQIC